MKKSIMVYSLSLCLSQAVSPAWAQDELQIKANAGIAYSSNVYHSPSAAYVDYAAATPLTINPNVQSGFFLPLSVDAKYAAAQDILLQYRFKGRYFLGSTLSNANVYDSKVRLGTDKDLDGAKLYAGAFLGWHTQTYFDKDTGLNKLTSASGKDISARYNYNDFGIEAKYQNEIRGVNYVIKGQFVSLTYDTVAVSELDNTQLHLGGYASFALTDGLKAKVSYKFYTQDYSKRKARDLSAALVATTRSYTFNAFKGQLRWQKGEQIKIFLDAGYIKRTDNFVGYNDYTKTSMKFRALYAVNQDISLRGKLLLSNTDYANAFIFEDPTLAKKTSRTTLISLSGKYKTSLLMASSFWAKLDNKNVSSNDLRYDYKLSEISIGGDWAF